MQLGKRPVDPDRDLTRVQSTDQDAQHARRQHDHCGRPEAQDWGVPHQGAREWFNQDGTSLHCEGTWLVVGTHKADEKAGTSAIKISDELISDAINAVDPKGLLTLRRAATSRILNLHESNAVMLELPPAKQRLDFRGAALMTTMRPSPRSACRTTTRSRSSLSAAQPDKLRIVRAPAPERRPPGKKSKAAGDGGKKKK